MSLRFKLLLFLFPSMLILFAGLYYAVSFSVEQNERQTVAASTVRHMEVISFLEDEQFEHLATKSQQVANLPIFKAALAERSPEQIKTVTDNLLSMPDSSLLVVSDFEGNILYQSEQIAHVRGSEINGLSNIKCALAGKECRTTLRIGKQIYHLISMPVSSESDMWGVLTTGFIYSSDFLEELRKATVDSEISLIDNNCRVTASTLPKIDYVAVEEYCKVHGPARPDILNSEPASNILELGRGEYMNIARAIMDDSGKPLAYLTVHQSLQKLEAIIADVQRDFVVLGSIVLLFLFLVDTLIARGLVRPIESLVDAAREISVGDRQLKNLSSGSKEVRQLASAINTTLQDLSNKTEELRNSEAKYRSMVDSAHDAVVSTDANMHIIVWNKQAEKLFGYSEVEIFGQHVNKIVPPQHHSQHRHVSVEEEGAVMIGRVRKLVGLHRDGSEIPIEINLSKSTDNKGNSIYTTYIRDLSSQFEAEARQRMLSNAIQQSSDMIVITDTKANILYVNPAFEQTTGYSLDEVFGQSTRVLNSGKQSPAFYEQMWGTILSGKVWKGRIINSRKNGELYPEEMTISPVTDEAGQIQHYVAIKRDITEQEKLKARIEHTQRLESLGVLAGGIAHDFNNILSAIMGNAAMAETSIPVKSPARENVDRIVDASHRAADLCKQMLAYSGKGQFVVKPINLSELVSQMAKLLEVSISKNIVINYDLNESLPAIMADVSQMQQVIMNLITNASDAIGEEQEAGKISISTSAIYVDERYMHDSYLDSEVSAGHYVYLEVSDNGCGMDEETREKIFDPFFTTKFFGRGLGMSAVLGIVRGHKGLMKIYSEPGRGSSFKILIPCVDAPARALDERKKTDLQTQGSGTVLIVDDEEMIREVATAMVTSMGFSVRTARDGVEGVETYRQHADEIVVVILDMAMPRMSGKDAFQEIRKINPDANVILTSGYNEQEAIEHFEFNAEIDFIQKPYTPDMLAAKLFEMLET